VEVVDKKRVDRGGAGATDTPSQTRRLRRGRALWTAFISAAEPRVVAFCIILPCGASIVLEDRQASPACLFSLDACPSGSETSAPGSVSGGIFWRVFEKLETKEEACRGEFLSLAFHASLGVRRATTCWDKLVLYIITRRLSL
jgi:hypothetical protein